MKRLRIALGIRAQLLLVLTVFLVIPFLGFEYVRELERVLRDAQERTLAGTAQAVATALHDRARLFDVRPVPLPSLATERKLDDDPSAPPLEASARRPIPHPGAVAEIGQILHGLSRTTARIWVIDRDLNVLARAGSLQAPRAAAGGRLVGHRTGLARRRARGVAPALRAGADAAHRGLQR